MSRREAFLDDVFRSLPVVDEKKQSAKKAVPRERVHWAWEPPETTTRSRRPSVEVKATPRTQTLDFGAPTQRRRRSTEPKEALNSVVNFMAAAWRAESAETEVSVAMIQAVQTPKYEALKQLANTVAPSGGGSPPQTPEEKPQEEVKQHTTGMHPAGQHVYYGSKIALQAQHGGFLSMDARGVARATVHNPTPATYFTLWNLANLSDTGVVRYGDRIWLQCGRYEVLGTTAMHRDVSAEWTAVVEDCAAHIDGIDEGPDWGAYGDYAEQERRITREVAKTIARKPPENSRKKTMTTVQKSATTKRPRDVIGRMVAVPCGGPALAKAKVAGRWVILNRRAPYRTLGHAVSQLDHVVLQQEWLLVSSRHPGTAELRVPDTQDDAAVYSIGGQEAHDDEEPSSPQKFDREFVWTLHIVELSTSSNDEQKRIRRALDARTQVDRSRKYAEKVAQNILRMRCIQHLEAKSPITGLRHLPPKHMKPSLDQLLASTRKAHWNCGASHHHVSQPSIAGKSFINSPQTRGGLSDTSTIHSKATTHVLGEKKRNMNNRVAAAKARYDDCLERQGDHQTFITQDRQAAELYVREQRAARRLQRFVRDRLKARWPWRLAKEDQRCWARANRVLRERRRKIKLRVSSARPQHRKSPSIARPISAPVRRSDTCSPAVRDLVGGSVVLDDHPDVNHDDLWLATCRRRLARPASGRGPRWK